MPKAPKDKPADKKPGKAASGGSKRKIAEPPKARKVVDAAKTKPKSTAPAVEAAAIAREPETSPEPELITKSVEVEAALIVEPTVPTPGLPPTAPAQGGYQRRPKPVKPALPANTQEVIIARAKYTVVTLPDAIEVSRPRKRDPKNPRMYKFTLKECEAARRHLSGRRVTLADAANLLKAVKVGREFDPLDGEARRQATKFLLVALASRTEAQLDRDGDLILVHVPFKQCDLESL